MLFLKAFDISATTIAFYGAIVSTLTAIAQITTFLRDRAKIRITVSRDEKYISRDEKYTGPKQFRLGDQLLPSEPEICTLVRVINAGRRSVTICRIGACLLYPRADFLAERIAPHVPCELSEGGFVMAVIDKQAELDFDAIEFWAAWNSLGRRFKLNIAPWYKRWVSALRRKFRIGKQLQPQTQPDPYEEVPRPRKRINRRTV